MQADESRHDVTIAAVTSLLKHKLSRKATAALARRGIATLADLRKSGGFFTPSGSPQDVTYEDARLLNSIAALSVLDLDPPVYTALAYAGVRSIRDLSVLTPGSLRSIAGDAIDDAQAEAVLREAAMGAVEMAHALVQRKLTGAGDVPAFGSLFKLACRCDCASAVSPQAYLVHLLRFALQVVRYQGVTIDVGVLQTSFRQPFRDLPATCASAEELVAQARIAVEVLRGHLAGTGNAAATSSPAWYREAAYLALLEFFSMTYDELRAAYLTHDLRAKSVFVNEKGLGLGLASDGQLVDEVYQDLAGLTEDWLEDYFGLRSTQRDPLSAAPPARALEIRTNLLASQWTALDVSASRPLELVPIVDPDLVDEIDLVDRVPGTPTDAVESWRPIDFLQRRRRELLTIESRIAAAFGPVTPPQTPAGMLKDLLFDLATGLSYLPPSAIPVPPAGFMAGGDILDYPRLRGIRDDAVAGRDVAVELARFRITEADVRAIVGYIELVENGGPVTAGETNDFRRLLLAHAKRVGFWPVWLAQEQTNAQAPAGRRLALDPRFFRLRTAGGATPDPAWTPRPRLADFGERLRWENVLRARVQALDDLRAELRAIVSKVEGRLLPELRNALIAATNANGVYLRSTARALTDRYQIDLEGAGCQQTTRVTQAIQTMQGLLRGIDEGLLNDAGWSLAVDDFDGIWRWLGTYETWRAAVLAFLYPEHLLRPSLRRDPSPGMQSAVELMRSREPIGMPEAAAAHDLFAEYLNDVASLRLLAGVPHVIAAGPGGVERTANYLVAATTRDASSRFYWSVAIDQFDGPLDQGWWRHVPAMKDASEVVGASLCGTHIALVTSTVTNTTRRLDVWRLALPPDGTTDEDILAREAVWEGPFGLSLPDGVMTFDSAAVTTAVAGSAPVVAIEVNERTVYSRPLALDATGWAGKFRSSAVQPLWRELGQAEPYGSQPANNATFACWLSGNVTADTVPPQFALAADVDGDGADEIIAFPDRTGFWAMKLFTVGSRSVWGALGTRPANQRLACTIPANQPRQFFAVSGDFDGDGVAEVAAIVDSTAPPGSIYTSWLDLFVRKWNGSNGTWDDLGAANTSGSQLLFPYPYFNPTQCLVGRFTQDRRDELLILLADTRIHSTNVTQLLVFGLVQGSWMLVENTMLPGGILPVNTPVRGGVACAGNFLGQPRHQLLLEQRDATGNPTGALWTLAIVNGAWRDATALSAGVISGIPKLIAGDFDGDGIDEAALADNSSSVRFFKCVEGEWQPPQTVGTGGPIDQIAAGDFEGDGGVSLVVTVPTTPSRGVPIRWDQAPAAAPQTIDLTMRSLLPARALIAGHFAGRGQHAAVAALGVGNTFYVHTKATRARTGAAAPRIERFKPMLGAPYSLFRAVAGARQLLDPAAVMAAATAAFAANEQNRPRNRAYLEEAFHFFIVETALRLQASGTYAVALEWLQLTARLQGNRFAAVGPFLQLDATGSLDGGGAPVGDPLDAHATARRRPGSYNRFSLIAAVRLLLEYGDAEYSLATAETVPHARELYESARALLETHPYAATLDSCETIVRALLSELAAAAGLADLVPDVRAALEGTDDAARVNEAAAEIRRILTGGQTLAQKREAIRAVLDQLAAADDGGTVTIGQRVDEEAQIEQAASLAMLHTLPDAYVVRLQSWARESLAHAHFNRHREVVLPQFAFCVPPSPTLLELKQRLDLMLDRLRTCRDIAGNDLVLSPIGTTRRPSSANASAALSGLQPLPYRYQTLADRAKQFVEIARQLEASMLNFIEAAERKRYDAMNARKDLALAEAAQQLRAVQVQQAGQEVGLAVLQRDRAQDQVDRYQSLIREGLNSWETAGLAAQWTSFGLKAQAVTSMIYKAAASPEGWVSGAVSWGANPAIEIALGQSEAAAALAQVSFTQAEYQRRAQSWGFSLQDARRDTAIGQQQVGIANYRLQGAQIEQQIGALQASFARDAVTFLTARSFANEALYEWMAGVLEGVYRYFLQQATQLARLAELQLAFERQETPQGFIKFDYWNRVAVDGSPDVASIPNSSDSLRGLTGAARLLRDLYQLDQAAFTKNQRKHQLTESVSLVQLDPLAFERLRETGRMVFETPADLFDRRLPGHYLRLIRRVRLTVVALTSPTSGVRATLSNAGLSTVVVPVNGRFEEVTLRRPAEQIVFTGPAGGTGLFDLDAQPELLAAFEGTGAHTRWTLDLPRPANPFDFASIADIILTVDYTSLSDSARRSQVIKQLPPRRAAERVFSIRREFADAWYDLHNAGDPAAAPEASFVVERGDFPPNLEQLRLTSVVLQVLRKGRGAGAIDIELLELRSAAGPFGGPARTDDAGVASSRRANAASWLAIVTGTANVEPVGAWRLRFPAVLRPLFDAQGVEDILLALGFEGATPPWPDA